MARGDLTDLQSRLVAEGFDYLASARQQELIAQAVEELGYERQWPDRVLTLSAIPPCVDSSGIARVFSVADGARALEEVTREELKRIGATLTQAGSPVYWYFTQSGAVSTWPLSPTVIDVEYLSRKLWAAGGLAPASGADTPLLPQGVRNLAVQLAAAKAFEENGRADLAAAKRAIIDAGVEQQFSGLSRRVTQRRIRVVD